MNDTINNSASKYDKIKHYIINENNFNAEDKEECEQIIKNLNTFLLSENLDNDVFEEFKNRYNSKENEYMNLDKPIISTIVKTLADEQGISSTREYGEIYFNEIIQNANDITTGDCIDIYISKDERESEIFYKMKFIYADNGFKTKNLVGFFDTEIHTKKNDLSSTGKHGVGIKSLFYFVENLKITSNVNIEIDIKKSRHTSGEQVGKLNVDNAIISLEKNVEWDKENTVLEITFREKHGSLFKVEKLIEFIEICFDKKNEIQYSDVEKFYFSTEQNRLIFDVRSLMFTDKNNGKEKGIKHLNFYIDEGDLNSTNLFNIKCIEECKTEESKLEKNITQEYLTGSIAKIMFNEEPILEYILFVNKKTNEQNFSIAFPKVNNNVGVSGFTRYYETYFIPDEKYYKLNALINTKYSNVSRTKLTNNDNDKIEIFKDIDENLLKVIKFMTSKEVGDSEIAKDVSILFHKLVISDITLYADAGMYLIDRIAENGINNRYLPKFENEENKGKYIVYKREPFEAYEKKYITQKVTEAVLIDYMNALILENNSIEFKKDYFIDNKIMEGYEKAFENIDENTYKYRKVFNIAGQLRDLIYYKMSGSYPTESKQKLTEVEIDKWHEKLFAKYDNGSILVTCSFSILGRYKLNDFINLAGDIKGSSFYEYLFKESYNTVQNLNYPTFAQKQDEMYLKDYNDLKNKLLNLYFNQNEDNCKGDIFRKILAAPVIYDFNQREEAIRAYFCNEPSNCKGYVCFYGSTRSNASANLYCNPEECKAYAYVDDNKQANNLSFGETLTRKLVEKIVEDKQIYDNIEEINEMVTIKYGIPSWGEIVYNPAKRKYLDSGVRFRGKLININFLRNIKVNNFDDFVYYVVNLVLRCFIPKNIGNWNIVTEPIKVQKDELNKLNKFFFNKDVAKLYEDGRNLFTNLNNNSRIPINLNINLTGEFENNLCKNDFSEYLYTILSRRFFVSQTTGYTKNKVEIICIIWKNIFVLKGTNLYKVGEVENFSVEDIYISHSDKITSEEAIMKVIKMLQDEIAGGDQDLINKCAAFISANSSIQIFSEEYNKFSNLDINTNHRSQIEVHNNNSLDLIVTELIDVITARGNNNNKCCCCGNELISKKLIITNNENKDTNNDLPQIYQVVCDKCESRLRKSLKTSYIEKRENEFWCVYECKANNTEQIKIVKNETKLHDGVKMICKKKQK